MSRKIERTAVSRHIHIFEEDWNWILANLPGMGPSQVIRNIVHKHLNAIRARQTEAIDSIRASESIEGGGQG